MNSSSRKLPLFFFFFFFIFFGVFSNPSTAAQNLTFDFPSFTLRNITLLGHSYLRNGVLGLSQELGVPASSSGSILFNSPISFFDPKTKISASFSTIFSFKITNVNPGSYGDGFTFFISPDNQTLGSPGGYLGLVNSSQLSKNKFIAVEFDTRLNTVFGDPNDNHIGLDIESLNSIRTEDAASRGIDLRSGNLITAWISYMDDQKVVNVWLSYSRTKPEKPILSVKIDLSVYYKEFMYVGFSSSTEGSTELHLITDWSFQTSGFHYVKNWTNPHNVSDSSFPVLPRIPDAVSSDNSNGKRLGLGVGVAGSSVLFIALVVFGSWFYVKRFRANRSESFRPELLKSPRQFRYIDLKLATKGFHSSRIVGYGSFGTVYQAIFPGSGATFAVKRTKETHEGKSEFLGELSIVACLRHKNLVQLQGWCTENGELLLVYEFMSNGSLDKVLYREPDDGFLLKWPQRYNIVEGIASVLTYLHQECEQQVIHRDIKTSNIMLDQNFSARLGDFGLARLMEHDKSPISTLTAGTMGYLAPEYLQYGIATEKTDVFSFGIVLLEVACGRRPIEKETSSQTMVNLVDWVWGLHAEGKIIEAADKRLNGEFNEEEMRKLLLVGLSCANPSSIERPSMRRVLQILNDEAELSAILKRKPSLTFSSSLPLSLDDIVSESEKSVTASPSYEINIE